MTGSGDFGTTTGANERTLPGPDGSMMTVRGHFVTVWRKPADGGVEVRDRHGQRQDPGNSAGAALSRRIVASAVRCQSERQPSQLYAGR